MRDESAALLRVTRDGAGVSETIWGYAASSAAVVVKQRCVVTSLGFLNQISKYVRAMANIAFYLAQILATTLVFTSVERHYLHKTKSATPGVPGVRL